MDNACIPSPFLPGGMPGSCFSRFFYDTKPIPLHEANFDNRLHAAEAARRATSICIPSSILIKANKAWKRTQLDANNTNRNRLTPVETSDLALGLTIISAFSNHLLRSYNKVKNKKPLACTCNDPQTGCDFSPIINKQLIDRANQRTNNSNTDNIDNSRTRSGTPACNCGGENFVLMNALNK